MQKPAWAEKCENIIRNTNRRAAYKSPFPENPNAAKDTLREIMEVLEAHSFVDTDWRFESNGYFED